MYIYFVRFVNIFHLLLYIIYLGFGASKYAKKCILTVYYCFSSFIMFGLLKNYFYIYLFFLYFYLLQCKTMLLTSIHYWQLYSSIKFYLTYTCNDIHIYSYPMHTVYTKKHFHCIVTQRRSYISSNLWELIAYNCIKSL